MTCGWTYLEYKNLTPCGPTAPNECSDVGLTWSDGTALDTSIFSGSVVWDEDEKYAIYRLATDELDDYVWNSQERVVCSC